MRVSTTTMWLQLLSVVTLSRPFSIATDPDASNPLRRLRLNERSSRGISKTHDSNRLLQMDPISLCQQTLYDAPEGSECLNSTRGPPGSYLRMEPLTVCCDALGNVCTRVTNGFRTSEIYFGDPHVARGYEFIKGRSERVLVEFDPVGDEVSNCTAWLDGQMCSSCIAAVYTVEAALFVILDDEYYAVPMEIDCENVREGSSYSRCGGDLNDSPFSAFVGRQSDSCYQGIRETITSANVALDTCNAKIKQGRCGCEEGSDALPPGSQLGLSSSASSICTNPSCIYCNFEGTVCGKRSTGSTYDESGGEESRFVLFEFEKGRNETIMLEMDGSNECRVTINGSQCNSCSRKSKFLSRTRSEGNSVVACSYVVDCENLVPGTGIQELFNADEKPIDGVFMPFSKSDEFETCRDAQLTAKSACESDAKNRQVCSCAPVEGSSDYVMTCKGGCDCYENFCGSGFNQRFYTAYGISTNTTFGFDYLGGQHETAIVKEMIDFETGEMVCTASIDDTECNSCEYGAWCAYTRYGCYYRSDPFADCSNIPGGGSFDKREESYSHKSDGLFGFVSQSSVGDCANSPTEPPTFMPTSTSTSMSMSMSYDILFQDE